MTDPAHRSPPDRKHREFIPPAGHGAGDLEQAVREATQSERWQLEARLPTTRELGERFGVSNATVSRVLERLAQEGVVWRRPNGRYYRGDAAKLLAEPKTYACLVRRLESWSRVYFALLGGFSRDFAQNRDAMLFFHNETLVRHTDTGHPPQHAGLRAQVRAVEEFLAAPRSNLSGYLFDDVWRDEALEPFVERLRPAVVVCRPTQLPGVASVSADFAAAATTAVAHLFARGYERVLLAVPFSGAAPIDLMVAAAKEAAQHLGRPFRREEICLVSNEERRQRVIGYLRGAKQRIGIFCPEDNVALQLWREITAAGISVPGQVGILAGMGTDVVRPLKLSTLQIDFEAIGRNAAELLREGTGRQVVLPATLQIGSTT